MIAIVDYGMGNLRSVQKALEHVGAEPEITRDHDRIRAAGAIVLPGVGAFPKAMEAIRAHELDAVIGERVAAGVPLLGICLGMQLLFESSTELGGAARFASALSPRVFRRRMARVSLTDEAAARLAPHGAAIARAEGFPVHGESMERRT